MLYIQTQILNVAQSRKLKIFSYINFLLILSFINIKFLLILSFY